MTIAQPALLAFNRGLISQLGLARTDLKRSALSASVQTNFMPRMLGSAMFRPGLQYVLTTNGNQKAKYMPFVFSTTDVTLLEATPNTLRMILPGADGTPTDPLVRPAVTTTITNGTFSGSLTGWTNADQAGALSQWLSGNLMFLEGNGASQAAEYQEIAVAGGNVGVEHALRIQVARGTVTLNVGTSAGDGTYAFNLALGVGTHSIAFTPTGNFFVQFSNVAQTIVLVQGIAIESAGIVTLPTTWGASDLPNLRWEQSAEVFWVACAGQPQIKIARWGPSGHLGGRSWSIAQYQPLDGPFMVENVTGIQLTPSGLSGEITINASQPFFQSSHVGALFRLASTGQEVLFTAGAANQWSNPIKVTGSGANQRNLTIGVGGTWAGLIVLQQSIGSIGAWQDVGTVTPGTTGIPASANWTAVNNLTTWAANVFGTVYDGWDNQTIYYRIGFEASYISGSALLSLSTASGSITGIARVVAVTNSVAVTADVLIQPGNTGVLSGLGNTLPTTQWWEGVWSPKNGYPSSVCLYDGRLSWFGKGFNVHSVSDGYESFDDTITGDSGPIIQQIGSGPVDNVNWALALADLIIDTPAREICIRSSQLGGIITPTDYVMKDCCTQGGSPIPALKIDYNGVFVQRSARRIYLLTYTPSFFLMDYSASDLTNFVPDIAIMENGLPIASPGFNWIALQRQPDTRIHALLNDGTARVCIFDPAEDEHAWIKVETAGQIVDCVVLPGQGGPSSAEDLVYYQVARTIGGQTNYYLERWAREDECIGGAVSKNMDSHLAGNSPTTTLSLPHLVGQTVVVWADGASLGSFAVGGGGTVTLPKMVTNWCAGLPYRWQFQSAKLAYAAELGTPLLQKKRIARIGVVAANMVEKAFQYGKDFDTLYDLPSIYKGAVIAPGTVFPAWDDETFSFPGDWDTDSRLCLQGQSPNPAILLAVVIDMETRERV